MLEKYQKRLENLKNTKKPIQMSTEFVQALFEMQDVNKWLKLNATNKERLQVAERTEKEIQNLLQKICVPNIQFKNAY